MNQEPENTPKAPEEPATAPSAYTFEAPPAEEAPKASPAAPASKPNPPYVKNLPPRPPQYEYKTRDLILAWVMWLVGYLFCVIVPITEARIPTFCFEVLVFIGATVLLARDNRENLSRSLPVTVVSLLLSVSFLVTYNTAIIVCVFLFTCVSWFYMVFRLSGRSEERFPGAHLVSEVFRSVCAVPFSAPGGLFSALFSSRGSRKNRVGHVLGMVLLGLLAAAVPTVIVGLLLSYDKGFTNLLDKIFDLTSIFRQIRQILFGLPVAFLMFGALLAALTRKERAGWEKPVVHADPAILPRALICAALSPLLILYVIFFISQWDYYMSAFTGVLPGDLTFAAYAREGFFQLCIVSGINAALCVLTAVFTRRRTPDETHPDRDPVHPIVKVYLTLLSLATLILIATALSKMILYVDTYGLTQLRVYSTWFMLLLAVSFLAVILRQIFKRMNLVGTLLCVFVVFFLTISLVNVDEMIVRYDVNAALDGNLNALQGDVLSDADLSGVLPALEFMEKTEGTTDPDVEKLRASTEKYLTDMSKKLTKVKPLGQNVVTLRARAALDTAGYTEKGETVKK